MRILIIADEVWNDDLHGNNVLTNWFYGFPAEIYTICCSPGKMVNQICKNYYQITDMMMVKSIFINKGAGQIIKYDDFPTSYSSNLYHSPEHKKLYAFLKSISNEWIRNIREYIWLHGKYDNKSLNEFLNEANPDIIFSARMASAKLLRLEQYVKDYTHKPLIAYTGDNECAIGEKKGGLARRIRINRIRKMMDKQVPHYSLYYSHSKQQAQEYSAKYGINTKILQKCGEFKKDLVHKQVHAPIKIVYAGKLYCERWKTLAEIAKILKRINENGIKMTLDIYTMDSVKKYQKKLLNDKCNVFLHPAVPAKELKNIYKNADIVLQVESFIPFYKAITKYSFSTKVIDYLASGCAVMIISSCEQASFCYLREKNAAITIESIEKIEKELKRIIQHPELIRDFAYSAYECGIKNHQREKVQKGLLADFENISKQYNNIGESL